MKEKPIVGIVMGSASDLPVMKKAAEILKEMGVLFEMDISSAHRLPDKTAEYAKSARGRGIEVIIAGAGIAAHLAGVIAAHTTLPVIGVPLASGALNGEDALYSTVQMPPGIPVATVAIDGAKNGAFLACSILSIKYPEIEERLAAYRDNTRKSLQGQSEQLRNELLAENLISG
ncbi:MAG: 5-(carboxyamino)imidazole ribonucleotide mutase [Desulfobulbaceae bacterium]|uniref:N5-carboxyaminoimidazole ribonucleotide mutase n=2 Tax=Desulfofustis glycolicus TaxID=51195 RepID=A0A1M5W5C1_9BACT|nr:5-(carboxyamino)imidazole ribonucleotide mutase [Desulfofustis glycolicus]MCB2217254.1 5-(carboxyamino)imidazole ribonucleotide mutase [Desulfobulbaceae bacterium]SHH82660.1 5-(carboxyamino)imidazole ribonucleotide mutase [Desulfofustis glycolicus DSM 9705]